MTAPGKQVAFGPTDPILPALRFELIGDEALSGGVGGWETVSRPRRKAATEWTGLDPYTLTLPLLITGMESSVGQDTSIEPAIRTLLSFAAKNKQTGQPVILRVTGPIWFPSSSIRWTINGLEWGARVRNDAGYRTYQEVTATLLEHVEATVLKGPAAKHNAKKKPKKKKK